MLYRQAAGSASPRNGARIDANVIGQLTGFGIADAEIALDSTEPALSVPCMRIELATSA